MPTRTAVPKPAGRRLFSPMVSERSPGVRGEECPFNGDGRRFTLLPNSKGLKHSWAGGGGRGRCRKPQSSRPGVVGFS